MSISKILKTTTLSALLLTSFVAAQSYTNISWAKPATASTIEGVGFEASQAFDGNMETRWASDFSNNVQSITVDLESAQQIDRVVLEFEAAYAHSFQVLVSNDGTNFEEKLASYWEYAGGSIILDADFGEYQYVQIKMWDKEGAHGISLYEVQVFSADPVERHETVKSLTFQYYWDWAGDPIPECASNNVGQMVVYRMGHYDARTAAYVCLMYYNPTMDNANYGWIEFANSSSLQP
ncbi:MAG: discoidin domain-containing protein [Fibrobacterales bacterium]